MNGCHAKCANQKKKACRNEIQWVPRPDLDGATGKLVSNRCEFCRQKNVLRPVGKKELAEIREAKARLNERGKS